jgi:hypothetical protein
VRPEGLFLTWALVAGEWLTLRPGLFTRIKELCTDFIVDGVGPTAGVDVLEKRGVSCSLNR